jgi:hypothetical protein
MHFALRERFIALAREAKPAFHANNMAGEAASADLRLTGSNSGSRKPRINGVH